MMNTSTTELQTVSRQIMKSKTIYFPSKLRKVLEATVSCLIPMLTPTRETHHIDSAYKAKTLKQLTVQTIRTVTVKLTPNLSLTNEDEQLRTEKNPTTMELMTSVSTHPTRSTLTLTKCALRCRSRLRKIKNAKNGRWKPLKKLKLPLRAKRIQKR